MENRENQQEITKEELAWLAGFLEGDGYITMSANKAAKKVTGSQMVVSPTIGFVNTDALLIDASKQIIDKILEGKGGHCQWQSQNSSNFSSKRKLLITLTVNRLWSCQKLLEALIPYFKGEKLGRAKLILQFVNKRLAHKVAPYARDEIMIVGEFVKHYVNAKGPKKRQGTGLNKFLNDYTLDN